jgi:hypothetical protein
MEIAITGAIGGRIDKTVPIAATNDLARTPQQDQVVAFSTDGKHAVSGYVLAAPWRSADPRRSDRRPPLNSQHHQK